MSTTATVARRPDPGGARWPRLLLAGGAALGLGIAAASLARVDSRWGAPLGPDRLMRKADADPAYTAVDDPLARRVLASRPIDGRAFRVLAQAAEAQGNQAHAAPLYAIALARAPRDRLALARSADRAFARGDIEEGIAQLDALLRVAPKLREDLLRRLAPHFHDPRVRDALVARLALAPNWRPALAAIVARDAEPRAGSALLARLAGQGPLTPAESAARVTLLRRLDRTAQARQLWLSSLPAGDRIGDTGTLFDGGFEFPHVADGYGWQIGSPPGVAVDYERGDVAEGDFALWLRFDGRALAPLRTQQWLALPAGDYRLEFAGNNATDSHRPFVLEVVCEGGATLGAAEFPVAATEGRWRPVQAGFAVPSGCPGQVLRLRHLARSLPERRVTGALGLDAIRITPGYAN